MTAITRLEHTPTVELSAGMSEFFGSAVASGEDVLAVGAPSASDGTEFIDGSVFLYHQQGGQWVAGEQLSPKEHQKSVNQSFGTALAFSGDVLYVGAPNAGDPLTGRLAGLVYVYQNTPAGWEEIAQLAPDEPATHENFGSHLSAQGDTLAVSGGFQGRSPARVVIFRRDGSRWTQEASLVAPGIQGGPTYIYSLAVYGDTLAVCATSTDLSQGMAQESRRLLVYERSGSEWRGPNELLAGEYAFSGTLALDGDGRQATRLAAGAGPGWLKVFSAVVIFERGPAGWELNDILASPDGGYMDHTAHMESFGASIALAGNTLLAGAPYSSEDDFFDGVVYLFRKEQDRWTCQLRLAPPVDGVEEGAFGAHIDLYGNTVLIAGTDESGDSVYVLDIGSRDP